MVFLGASQYPDAACNYNTFLLPYPLEFIIHWSSKDWTL
jgi:hypothetical protein